MKNLFNMTAQIAIPTLTIFTQIAIALKYPQWGLIINMFAQPFWIYSTWKSYKEAGQIGMFVTTIVITVVLAFGILNYWFL